VFTEFGQAPGMSEAVDGDRQPAGSDVGIERGDPRHRRHEIHVQIVTSLPWMFVTEAGGDDRSDILLPSAHRLAGELALTVLVFRETTFGSGLA
jgi:hypothetical protein